MDLPMNHPLSNADADGRRSSTAQKCIADQRKLFEQLGVDMTDLECSEWSLLMARSGTGLQPVHFDIPVYRHAVRMFTVILYCTPTMSTAFPKLSLANLRDTFTTGEAEPSLEAMEKLTDDKFISLPVQPGQLAVFRCDVPHYGVLNTAKEDRVVAFFLWGQRLQPHHCTIQRYPLGEDHHQKHSSGLPSRAKRPMAYETLQPTERWKRRKKATAAVTQVLDHIGASRSQ